jgi:hypothetical protein
MKKALLLAAVVAMIAGSTAMAQESVYFFDVRDSVAGPYSFPYTQGGLNGGGPGDGQVMYVTPQHGDGFETVYAGAYPNIDGDGDNSTGKLSLYVTVNDDDTGGLDDVISSIGLDFNLSDAGAGGKNRLASLSFAWDLPAEANAGSVDGSSVAGDPPSWAGAKAVKVPVEAGPVYAAGAGMVPVNTYNVGALTAQGGIRTCPPGGGLPDYDLDSSFAIYMQVNDLLITRVFSSGGDADEQVAFGYSASVAGVDTASIQSGSSTAAPAGDPDGIIVVTMKGDNDANGIVDNNDISGFVAAKAASSGPPFLVTVTQEQLFLNDFVTLAPPGDTNRVDANDTAGFNQAKATGGIQPFPPPGNCP